LDSLAKHWKDFHLFPLLLDSRSIASPTLDLDVGHTDTREVETRDLVTKGLRSRGEQNSKQQQQHCDAVITNGVEKRKGKLKECRGKDLRTTVEFSRARLGVVGGTTRSSSMRDGGGMLGEHRCVGAWESSVIVATTIATGATTSLRLAMLLRKLGRLLQEVHVRKTTKKKHHNNKNNNNKDVHKTLDETSKCG
jgi:hypothetical protein